MLLLVRALNNNRFVEELRGKYLGLDRDQEMMRQLHTRLKYEISDMEDALKQELASLSKKQQEMLEKLEELLKAQNEKKTILNLPTSFDDDLKKRKRFDEEVIMEALEKMRDYISFENKRIKDELFKFHLEFETKVREKLDKKELEEIESKITLTHLY